MISPQSNIRGITYMLTGMFLFTVNDALGKWLIVDCSVGQLIAIRSMAALLILIPYLWHKGLLKGLLTVERPIYQAVRIVFVIAEVAFFYLAVRHLPLADVFMFYLSAPIFVTVLSVVVLREHVGMPRWLAVVAGFAGVVLIFPPSGAALTLPALFALAGSLSFAAMIITARSLRGVDGLTLIAYQTMGVAVAGVMTAPFDWKVTSSLEFALLGLLGVTATVAHFMINKAVNVAPAAVVAPYQYTSILWGIPLGYWVWGDIPTARTLSGAALVVGAGLFILYRERRAHKTSAEISTYEVI